MEATHSITITLDNYRFDLRPDGLVCATRVGRGIPIDVFPLNGDVLSVAAHKWVADFGDAGR